MIKPTTQVKMLDVVEAAKLAKVVNGIIYGPSGGGKTFLLGSASEQEELRPALIVTFDGIDPTLSKFPKAQVLDFPHLALTTGSSVSKLMDKLVSELNNMEPSRYNFVGLDNISKLVNPLMKREIIKKAVAATRNRATPHDPNVLELQDYQVITNMVYDWLDAIRLISMDKNFHLFVTAREKDDYIETSEYTGDIFFPDMPPELRRLATYEFDFVYRLRHGARMIKKPGETKPQKQEVRFLMTRFKSSFTIKDRIHTLPDKTIDPSAWVIIKALSNGVDSSVIAKDLDDEEEQNGTGEVDAGRLSSGGG